MNRIQDGFVSLNRALELDPNNKYANYNRGNDIKKFEEWHIVS